MDKQNQIVKEVKSILPLVVNFQETYGFEDFDYGCLYGAGKWECSFFKKIEDKKPSLYFLENSLEELIIKLETYGG